MHRIAFVKYGGMTAGGTEKFLQTVAANLDRSRFACTYFYSADDSGVIDENRLNYLEGNGVTCVQFRVKSRDLQSRDHRWIDTDFWDRFRESDFDLVQSGRAGHREYPFHLIRDIPIVDSLHLNAGVDNQRNIAAVLLLSDWSRMEWIKNGGDKKRAFRISHPVAELPITGDLRDELGIGDRIVFGMHQRPSDNIFSTVPLEAYTKIASDRTAFVLLGGSELYQEQARKLSTPSVHFVPYSSEQLRVAAFLRTLDVYAHGRMDGEINSTALAEAMSIGLPVVTHTSLINHGHVEQVDGIGFVANTADEYAQALDSLIQGQGLRRRLSARSRERFAERYALGRQVRVIESIYETVLSGEAKASPQLWCWLRQSQARAVRVARRLAGLR